MTQFHPLRPTVLLCLLALALGLMLSACQQGQESSKTKAGAAASGQQSAGGSAETAAEYKAAGGRQTAVKGDEKSSAVFIDATSSMQPEKLDLAQLHKAAAGLAPAEAFSRFEAAGYSFDAEGVCKAATKGDGEAVAMFLAAGGDVNAVAEDAPYDCALLTAVVGGFGNLTEFLLDKGANIEYQDTQVQGTPLSWTAVLGNLDMLQLLERRGANLQALSGAKNQNALMFAAQFGNSEVARHLIERGLPLEATDSAGVTALFMAAKGGFTDCCRVLVEAGANPNMEEPDRGFNPVLAACYMLKYETADYLVSAGGDIDHVMKNGATVVDLIGLAGEEEGIEWMAKHKLNLNQQNAQTGETLLMLAAGKGSSRLVQTLLLHHADPFLSDSKGRTAMDYALAAKDQSTIDMLKKVMPKSKNDANAPTV